MSENASKEITQEKGSLGKRALLIVGLPMWVFISFLLASLLVGVAIAFLAQANLLSASIDESILNTTVAAVVYALTLVIVIGVPLRLRNIRTTKDELGLTKLPTWMDLFLAPAAFIAYMIMAALLMTAVSQLIPGFDAEEAQDVGFDSISHSYEYILAFVTLVVVAPVAEEILVRGYLYGKLRKSTSVIVAMLVSALLFSAMHMQWNVALNVLPLGIVLVLLREMTGSIWAGIFLHMLKNGVAFYLLFVDPSILNTLGG